MSDDPFMTRLYKLAVSVAEAMAGQYVGARMVGANPADAQASAKVAGIAQAVKGVFDLVPPHKRTRISDTDLSAMLRQQMNMVYLVRGKDHGRPAWHYIEVFPTSFDGFERAIATGSLDVSDYGRILSSGWGQDPPGETVRAIESAYQSF